MTTRKQIIKKINCLEREIVLISVIVLLHERLEKLKRKNDILQHNLKVLTKYLNRKNKVLIISKKE